MIWAPGVLNASELAMIFRPLLWTELENIFLDNLILIMKANKAELLNSYYTFISIKGSGIKTEKYRKELLRKT